MFTVNITLALQIFPSVGEFDSVILEKPIER